jgi:hypothetical protein
MASQVEELAIAVRFITSDTKDMATRLAQLQIRIAAVATEVANVGMTTSGQATAQSLAGLLEQAIRTMRGAIASLEQASREGDRYAAAIAGGGQSLAGTSGAGGGDDGEHPPAASSAMANEGGANNGGPQLLGKVLRNARAALNAQPLATLIALVIFVELKFPGIGGSSDSLSSILANLPLSQQGLDELLRTDLKDFWDWRHTDVREIWNEILLRGT